MITVVTGPPCSGKSTYVRQHAQPGDIVIDFDVLAQALGSATPHQHSSATRHVTIAARRAAIEAAVTVHDKTPVWIVDTQIPADRMELYKGAGARIITLTASRDELHRRATRERPALWHRLIEAWQPSGEASSREW